MMKILKCKAIGLAVVLGCLLPWAVGCGAADSAKEPVWEASAVADETEVSIEAPGNEEDVDLPGTDVADASGEESAVVIDEDEVVVRVGAMKGPTTMGLVKLMEENEAGDCEGQYAFTMVTAADELTALVAGGKVDIALVPANVAAILYQKTAGAVSVIDINTLNVLYLVSADDGISSLADLKGRCVYLPGKGSTPEYALRYLLEQAGLSEEDVTLEFKSEATEVASILAENPEGVGLLPQPFATSALLQNDALSLVLDLGQAWQDYQDADNAGQLVTGVTIVRNDFLHAYQKQVDTFLKEHEASISFVKENPEESAVLIEKAQIVAKAAVAQKALPYCNIDFLSGDALKEALHGYLTVLYGQNPAAVGNALPDDTFYYIP